MDFSSQPVLAFVPIVPSVPAEKRTRKRKQYKRKPRPDARPRNDKGDKPYVCTLCNLAYTVKRSLALHTRLKHPDVQPDVKDVPVGVVAFRTRLQMPVRRVPLVPGKPTVPLVRTASLVRRPVATDDEREDSLSGDWAHLPSFQFPPTPEPAVAPVLDTLYPAVAPTRVGRALQKRKPSAPRKTRPGRTGGNTSAPLTANEEAAAQALREVAETWRATVMPEDGDFAVGPPQEWPPSPDYMLHRVAPPVPDTPFGGALTSLSEPIPVSRTPVPFERTPLDLVSTPTSPLSPFGFGVFPPSYPGTPLSFEPPAFHADSARVPPPSPFGFDGFALSPSYPFPATPAQCLYGGNHDYLRVDRDMGRGDDNVGFFVFTQ